MNILNNLSLKFKILLIIILPLTAYLCVSGSNLFISYQQLNTYNAIHKLALLSGHINNLVHELQKERGTSAGFLGSQGETFGGKFNTQQRETDAKRKRLTEYLEHFDLNRFDPELEHKINKALSHLSSLESERRAISSQQRSVQEAITYYTAANSMLLDIIGYMTHLSNNASLTSQVGAYYNFLQSKERAGKERAVLSGVFSRGTFSPEMYALFIQLVTEQNTYLSVFETLATADEKQFLQQTVRGSAVEKVKEMRQIAQRVNLDQTKQFGVDGVDWFETVTQKIKLLKQVEDYLATELEQRTAKLASSEKTKITVSLIIFAVIISSAVILVYVVTSTMLNGIKQATSVALELAEGDGDLTKRMHLDTEDEIGILGRAIDRMLDNLSSMIAEIQRISKSFDTANIKLIGLSSDMQDETENVAGRASTVAAASEEMSVNMDTVTTAVEDAAQNVVSVATATEEIALISNEISTDTEKAKIITSKAVRQAANSSEQIHKLGQAAQEIDKVTESITEISEQTNLLALNATIEAARAGEAGRGFAIVADEIKDLAKQTANATLEIKSKVGGIHSSTRGTVLEIEEISKVIDQINEIVMGVSESVETQTATANKITGDITQTSQGIQEVTENVSQASTVSREVAMDIAEVDQSANQMLASTDKVNTTAEELSTLAGQLQGLVGTFKI